MTVRYVTVVVGRDVGPTVEMVVGNGESNKGFFGKEKGKL